MKEIQDWRVKTGRNNIKMKISSACNNSVNQWTYFISGTENAILVSFTALLIPLTIVANFSVIYSIIKTKQVNDGVNNMFICLSSIDCFIAAVCEVSTLLLLTVYRSKRTCELELLVQYSSSFLCNFSGMLILSIAIDRYIKTHKTMKMKIDRGRRRSIYLMIISGIVALTVALLDVLGTLMTDYAWINLAIQFAQLIVVIVIYILYIMMYCKVSRNRKILDKRLNLRRTSRQDRLTYVRRTITTISIILGTVLFCYFPFLIIGIHTAFKSTEGSNSPTPRKFANYLSFQFGFTNSFLSAVIYLHRNKGCRNYILKRLHLTSRVAVSASRSEVHSRTNTILPNRTNTVTHSAKVIATMIM